MVCVADDFSGAGDPLAAGFGGIPAVKVVTGADGRRQGAVGAAGGYNDAGSFDIAAVGIQLNCVALACPMGKQRLVDGGGYRAVGGDSGAAVGIGEPAQEGVAGAAGGGQAAVGRHIVHRLAALADRAAVGIKGHGKGLLALTDVDGDGGSGQLTAAACGVLGDDLACGHIGIIVFQLEHLEALGLQLLDSFLRRQAGHVGYFHGILAAGNLNSHFITGLYGGTGLQAHGNYLVFRHIIIFDVFKMDDQALVVEELFCFLRIHAHHVRQLEGGRAKGDGQGDHSAHIHLGIGLDALGDDLTCGHVVIVDFLNDRLAQVGGHQLGNGLVLVRPDQEGHGGDTIHRALHAAAAADHQRHSAVDLQVGACRRGLQHDGAGGEVFRLDAAGGLCQQLIFFNQGNGLFPAQTLQVRHGHNIVRDHDLLGETVELNHPGEHQGAKAHSQGQHQRQGDLQPQRPAVNIDPLDLAIAALGRGIGVELGDKGCNIRGAILDAHVHGVEDGVFHILGDIFHKLVGLFQDVLALALVLGPALHGIGGGLAGNHFVQGGGQGINIGVGALVAPTAVLLLGGVAGLDDNGQALAVGGGSVTGGTEVDKLDVPGLGDKNVVRSDVPVQQALLVYHLQRLHHRHQHGHRIIGRNGLVAL